MAMKTLKAGPAKDLRRLTAELAREWRNPGEGEPIIIPEETDRGYRRWYVIWTEWEGVGGDDRGTVIMDAYRTLASVEDIMKVTYAVGLTPAEAGHMGIEYE
jgi:hypothetical protein